MPRKLPASALWAAAGAAGAAAILLTAVAALRLAAPTTATPPSPTTVNPVAAQAMNRGAPVAAVEQAAAELARAVAAAGTLAEPTPATLRSIAEPLLDHLDVPHIAALLLGRHWRDADARRPELRRALEDYFVLRYAPSLRDLSGWRLQTLPDDTRLSPGELPRARVPVLIGTDGLPALRVELHLRRPDGVWRLYDASIFGVGLIGLQRPAFDQLAAGRRLDALLALLRQPRTAPAPAG
ncbi:MAG: ABC transporter substrate-binding protein [Thiohalocapsa sp.]